MATITISKKSGITMFSILLAGLVAALLASPAGIYEGSTSNIIQDTQPQVTMATSKATCDRGYKAQAIDAVG
ncbi:hypothetical protein CRD60_05970 [Bifidobacterium aemilianum]|uniref:Uncharacterized protein n=1 Tax=Bifidobacterium aemilianum TaxID=2493120 RepID=A0A366KA47_9BIFI|nr:hypothetical protein CRD60_05970 [Bifidobacterium aemilianum]